MDDDRYRGFPDWFSSRLDDGPDAELFAVPRLVTHLDDAAIGEVARVLRPGCPFVCTSSSRCFPTKAVAGWVHSDPLYAVWAARRR